MSLAGENCLTISLDVLSSALYGWRSLGISLGVPRWGELFTIDLNALSSALYGWRSLEATATEGLKARGRRLNSRA